MATLTAVPCLSFKVATLTLKYNVNIQNHVLIIILAIHFNITLTLLSY